MMRVAVEATSVAPGGGLTFLRGALAALSDAGGLQLDVFLPGDVAPGCDGPRVRPLVVGPFRGLVHRLAWVQTGFPRLARGYDAILAPGNLAPLPVAAKTVLFVQNAHVVPQREWRAEYRTTKRRLQRLMARASIRRSGRILFISEALKTWARPYWSLNRHEPSVAHPGVTMAPLPVSASDRRPDVLVVGNLVPHKRVDRAVLAFARLVREGRNAGRLRIAGSEGASGLRQRLGETAARCGVADRIDFAGFLVGDALARAYATSGCYLSTSALEALPLPPLEAMAAGTPVVVPDSPPFREVCGPAALYSSGEEETAGAIALALEQPASREELQRAARERVARFSWRTFADRMTAAIGLVAGS
jgi:glycosyltransferase involved in cell wall biosynthesis